MRLIAKLEGKYYNGKALRYFQSMYFPETEDSREMFNFKMSFNRRINRLTEKENHTKIEFVMLMNGERFTNLSDFNNYLTKEYRVTYKMELRLNNIETDLDEIIIKNGGSTIWKSVDGNYYFDKDVLQQKELRKLMTIMGLNKI